MSSLAPNAPIDYQALVHVLVNAAEALPNLSFLI